MSNDGTALVDLTVSRRTQSSSAERANFETKGNPLVRQRLPAKACAPNGCPMTRVPLADFGADFGFQPRTIFIESFEHGAHALKNLDPGVGTVTALHVESRIRF